MPYSNATVYETNGTTLGSIVSYFCEEGYELIGSETISCQSSGIWSDEAPQCLSMYYMHFTGIYFYFSVDCEIPNSKDNMIASYSDTVLDSVAVYSCLKGYNIVGDITKSICQDDGEWSDIIAECIKGMCTIKLHCHSYYVLCSWMQHT